MKNMFWLWWTPMGIWRNSLNPKQEITMKDLKTEVIFVLWFTLMYFL